MSEQFDPTSEQVVIAAALRDPEALRSLVRRVSSDDCYAERHSIIWSVLRELVERGLGFDGPTFDRVAADLGFEAAEYGGEDYLADLVEAYADDDGKNLDWHVERARVEARLRYSADEHGEELLGEMRSPGPDPSKVADLARRILGDASKAQAGGALATSGADAGKRYVATLGRRAEGRTDHIPTGLGELDEILTWGWLPGKVTVGAARPSNGKTSFSYNVAKWWIDAQFRGKRDDPRPVLMCPLEMGSEALQDGIAARAAGVDVAKLIRNFDDMTTREKFNVGQAVENYVGSPWISYFDEPGASVSRIEQVLAAASEPHPLDPDRQRTKYGLVVWDLFDKSLPDLGAMAIAEALNEAQRIAKDWSTHLLLLAQIRRGVEKRRDKRPTREDLKGSGGWEEVADQILGFHRERVYDPDLEEDTFEIGVLKQRVGPFGTWLEYRYRADCFRIEEFVDSSSE